MMNIFPKKNFKWDKIVRFCLILITTTILTLTSTNIVHAQFVLSGSKSTSSKLPEGVERYGHIEIATVKSPIDGKELFQLASPTIFDRSDISEDLLPAEIRAEEVTANLKRALLGKFKNPSALKVSIATLNNQPIIEVSDDQTTRPLRLVTVTELDADFEGKSPEELAAQWKTILEAELTKSIELFSPQELAARIQKVFWILVVAILFSALFWLFQRALADGIKKVKTKQAEKEAENSEKETPVSSASQEEAIALMRTRFMSQIKNQFSLQKQLSFYSFWQWILFWLQILVWYSAAVWTCSIIPVLMQYRNWVLTFPLDILFIWFVTGLAIKLSNRIIDRIFKAWKATEFLPMGESERKEMRTGTISQAVKGLVTFFLLFAALAYILDLFGISTSSIIAGGAVIGFAISLGSQNVIKDLVNGFLILVEDQYAVGDVVKLGNADGLVENLNLRVTQIRNGEGSLVTIPNSSIMQVENLTRNWSRVNFTIEVAYDADIDLALNLLKQVSEEMFNDQQWQEKILEMPQVLGVDGVSHTGILIRVWIKTAPLQQWSVGREFRYRVRNIFEQNNVEIGKPQTVNYFSSLPFHDSNQQREASIDS